MRTNSLITNSIAAISFASVLTENAQAFAPYPTILRATLQEQLSRSKGFSPSFYEICADCEIPIEQARGLMHQPLTTLSNFDELKDQVKAPQQLPDVRLSLLSDENNAGDTKPYPLVISPRHSTSVSFLSNFLKRNREWVDQQMVNYGAVLIRGFDVDSAEDVETSVSSFQPNLNNEYRGTSPRSTQGSTKYIFSAAEVPSNFPIAQHLEMSFLPQPPKQLFFSALQAPQVAGGETALADFRKVYQDLPKALRNKLASKKILYRRTYERVGAKQSIDVASMKGWPELFGTADKSRVEKLSRDEDTPMRWEGPNNDTWVSEFVSEPFQLHPQTSEPTWFNHAQVFHWTTFPAELLLAFKRTKDVRYLVRATFLFAISFVKYGLLGKKMALEASFGDGTPINIFEMHQIRKAIHKNMVLNRWEKGDMLFIDNFSTSHGRQPTYDSGRKVVVAWSDPIKKSNIPIIIDGVQQVDAGSEWQ